MTTAWEGTLAVKVAVDLPRSFWPRGRGRRRRDGRDSPGLPSRRRFQSWSRRDSARRRRDCRLSSVWPRLPSRRFRGRGGLDEILADVASETVPTVPAHGRSEGQTVFQCVRVWNAKKNSGEDEKRQATWFLHKRVYENPSAYSRYISFRAQ